MALFSMGKEGSLILTRSRFVSCHWGGEKHRFAKKKLLGKGGEKSESYRGEKEGRSFSQKGRVLNLGQGGEHV